MNSYGHFPLRWLHEAPRESHTALCEQLVLLCTLFPQRSPPRDRETTGAPWPQHQQSADKCRPLLFASTLAREAPSHGEKIACPRKATVREVGNEWL